MTNKTRSWVKFVNNFRVFFPIPLSTPIYFYVVWKTTLKKFWLRYWQVTYHRVYNETKKSNWQCEVKRSTSMINKYLRVLYNYMIIWVIFFKFWHVGIPSTGFKREAGRDASNKRAQIINYIKCKLNYRIQIQHFYFSADFIRQKHVKYIVKLIVLLFNIFSIIDLMINNVHVRNCFYIITHIL